MDKAFLIIVGLLVLMGCNIDKPKNPSMYKVGEIVTSKLNSHLTCIIKNARYISNYNKTYEYSLTCVRDGDEDNEIEKTFMEYEIKEK